jgi:hypothetical protein
MPQPPIARTKLDSIGIDALLERLEQGESISSIASGVGVSATALKNYLHADDDRSARTQAALSIGAEVYETRAWQALDIKAEVLDNPAVATALVSLAREQAQALWRSASVRDRRFATDRASVVVNNDNRRLQQLTIVSVPTGVGTAPMRGGGGQSERVLASSGALNSEMPVLKPEAVDVEVKRTDDLFGDSQEK